MLERNLREIEKILRFLVKLSNDCYDQKKDVLRGSINGKAYDTYCFLSTILRPVRGEQLNYLISHEPDGRLRLEVKNFYLPPFYKHNKEFIPVLNIEANFMPTMPSPKLDLRVALVTIDYALSRLYILGYRYELPHVNNEESEHNYCHQQFTRKPLYIKEEHEDLCEMVDTWVPEHLPCTIIPAKTPVEHFICMLIGLYGSKARDLVIKMDIGGEYEKPLEYLVIQQA
jgi:hypothetical protein